MLDKKRSQLYPVITPDAIKKGGRDVNADKLKGYIVEKRKTYADCAKATNMSITSFSKKMNGKSVFDIVEINDLIQYLNMPQETATNIFLQRKLHNM